jgi:hypothetical protein
MPSLAHASDDSKEKADKLAKQMAVVNFTVGSLPFMSHAQHFRRRCHLLSSGQAERVVGGVSTSGKMTRDSFRLSRPRWIFSWKGREREREREGGRERDGNREIGSKKTVQVGHAYYIARMFLPRPKASQALVARRC